VEYLQGLTLGLAPALLKAGLHYSYYCSKLVHFVAQKIFSLLKKALALSDFRHSVNTP
jgi:hypothetical protein